MPAPKSEPFASPIHEALRASRLSLWRYEFDRRVLTLQGDVVARLGLPGEAAEMDIADWRGLVCPDDHPIMDAATSQFDQAGFAEVAYRLRDASGDWVWLSLRGGLAQDGPAAITGVIYELGAEREAERRGLERERQLADGVEAGMVGIWTYDFLTGEQSAHGQILDWMGRAREDSIVDGDAWRDIIHPEDSAAMRAAHEGLMRGEAVEPLDVRLAAPQGLRWVRTSGRVLSRTREGEPLRAAGIILDVDAERRFAEALSVQQARFERIYRSMPALLHSINTEGLTTLVSDYWLQRMGRSRDDVIGLPGWAFMDEESAGRVQREIIPRTFAQGMVENEPIVAFTASGERLELRLSAFLERDPDGEPKEAHGVFSDVTDLAQARRDLEAHAEALERSNRELNRFATVASHDLQEPLRKISAFASLLQHRHQDGLGAESDQALDFLIDAAGRMRALIDDLLAYSRASNRPLETERVALRPLIDKALEELSLPIEEARARISISDMPDVTGDKGLLHALFLNLVSNAVKYRRSDGVKIDLSGRSAPGGMVEICVADDGIGIDPDFHEKIFAPFARLHGREEYSGTGIGLAICQQAAERMGGQLRVESAAGEGSRFHFTVPAA